MITSLVVGKMDEDSERLNGPNTIKQFLAIDGYAIPRYVEHFPSN